ncbi:hypothetical protein Tco_1262372 [Tanacetum coccineum]
MSNRHQELTSPEQTASGQTTTGKESSNPLMADSLPKTIQFNDPPLSRGYTLGSGEDTTASTNVHGEVKLTASIDGQAKTITEASLRRYLKLEDDGGITSLPNTEIFEQLALMGYATDSNKLTFQKGNFSPPWRFFIHTILHCLSPRKTSWEQFSSNLATAIICLTPSTSPPPIPKTTPTAEEPALMPHESPLQSVHSLGCYEGSVLLNELMDLVTQLTNKVRSLENELMNTKKVYGSAITKLVNRVKKLEKQGRSLIEELDMDADFSLVPPHDEEIQEKISDDTEVLLEEEEPTELVEDQGSGEKGEQEVTTADTALNTASVPFSTASATPEVSTAAESLSKKQVQEERLGYEEAIRLQEQIDEEERKRIARDAEIAKQLQEEYDKVGKKEVVSEVDIAHVIDWDDPALGVRYHALQNRPRSVAEVRKNMMVYLKNHGGYKMKDFKGISYDDIRPIFEKSLVQEKYNSSELTEDKEIELWVKLKMLFEPNAKNLLELQKYMHDPLKWWLYDMCAVHHVSTEKGQDIFMLVEKDYPLTKGLATLMLSNKLRVDQQSEMADELLTKIYNIANKSRK